jgi:hypothetical protein
MSRNTMLLARAFLAGVVLAGQVRQLPLLNKLPSV